MNCRLILLSALALSGAAFADSTSLSTAEVQQLGSVSISAGDTLRVFGESFHAQLDPAALHLESGVLVLENLVLQDESPLSSTSFPLTIQQGQSMYLNDVQVYNATEALHCDGGELHLSNSRIAASSVGVRVSGESSVVTLEESSFSVSNTGVRHEAGNLQVNDCTFLTLDEGLYSTATTTLELQDISFQGNEVALRLEGAGTAVLESCDFRQSRYHHVENLEGPTVEFHSCYMDSACPSSSGSEEIIDPVFQPRKPAQTPLLEIFAGFDEDEILELIPMGTDEGIPYQASRYVAEYSADPYDFSSAQQVDLPANATTAPFDPLRPFVRVNVYIGDWAE